MTTEAVKQANVLIVGGGGAVEKYNYFLIKIKLCWNRNFVTVKSVKLTEPLY